MMGDASLVITIPAFAKMLGISRGSAYSLARQNKLPVNVIKLGRRMVLSRKAIEALLGAGKVKES